MYRFPRRFRWFRWTVILVGLWALFGFFVLPIIVKSQLEKRASAELARTVTVGKVRVNPFALSLTLEDVGVSERDRRAGFMGWKRLYVNFDAWKSLFGAWVLGNVELDGLRGNVNVGVDGTLNFSDLLARAKTEGSPPARPAKPSRPVRIDRLLVTRAAVALLDVSRSPEFSTLIGPMTFELRGFRTAGPGESPYQFQAVTEAGEKLAWSGSLTASPFRTEGEFRLEDVLLPKYAPYYGQALRAVVEDGKISVSGRYSIDLGSDTRRLQLADGAVQVRDLRVMEAGVSEPLLVLPSLDVTGVAADAEASTLSVARVAVKGGSVGLRREVDGSLNVARLVGASPTRIGARGPVPSSTGKSTPLPKKPHVEVGEVAVENMAVHVKDLAAARPAQIDVGALKINVKNFSLADGAEMPVQVGFDWAPNGAVQLEGAFKLKPTIEADLVTVATDVALLPVSPYLEQFVRARVTQGSVTAQTRVHLALPESGPVVSLKGDVSLAKFGLVDAEAKEELAGFDGLTLKGMNVKSGTKLDVAVDEVAVAAPYARVLVRPDHTVNLATLAVPPKTSARPSLPAVTLPNTTAETTSAKAGGAANEPQIEVARVTIADGKVRFADRSIEPGVSMEITRFGGTIAGLSSENLVKADVDLSASVDGSGPVTIKGQFDPLGASKSVDLKIDLRNVDLQPLSPYTGKFAGYELARGKLRMDVAFQMKDRALDAKNVVTLDQFTWGAATNSPDATKLPVRLGVALLKDVNGKIVLDVPVEGNLDDPEFRIGRVVWRVVGNLLTKAAVSPFALLGSMFGGGGEELAYQQFAPGATTPLESERGKLDTMVKALKNRPGLSVAVEGGYDATVDAYALKRRKFESQVRAEAWELRRASDSNVPPPEKLAVSAEERAAVIKRLFEEKFPGETTMEKPPVENTVANAAPPPESPKPAEPAATPDESGLVKRTWNLLTLKAWRERHDAERDERIRRAADEQRRAEAERNAAQAKAEALARNPANTAEVSAIGLPIEEMANRLTSAVQVSPDDLRELAAERARAVRDYFTEAGIAAERVFLAENKDAAKLNKGPRVTLSLQ